MTAASVAQAADNNARWCDAVCSAHGIPGVFLGSHWLNRFNVPRFYPNAVMLAPTQPADEQRPCIDEQVARAIPATAAVKDSFLALNLAPFGFHIAFHATWIARAPTLPKPDGAETGIVWVAVQNAAELAHWEAAWSGVSGHDPALRSPRIFLPSLLAHAGVAFFAAYRGRQIVAGAIANSTSGVVGLSNVFVPNDGVQSLLAGGVGAVMDVFPRLPLVGYERGSDLVAARALGFEELGPLRVWTRAN